MVKRLVKKLPFISVLLIGFAISVTVTQYYQPAKAYASTSTCTETVSPADQAQIDSVIQGVMTKYAVPGASLAVTKDGRLVYAKGYGVSNKTTGEPVTTTTRFRTASTGKPMTATGIMMLVQAGRINLDAKVFGPNSILGTTYTTAPRDSRINTITVRQLLAHTSGFWTNDRNDPIYSPASWSQSDIITWNLRNKKLLSTPGSKYAYSNFGYLVLGRIIEKVTGESYASWTTTNILTPAGITNMQLATDTLAGRAADESIYYSAYGDPYSYSLARIDSAGGWMGTATDLARFLVKTDAFDTPSDFLTNANTTLMTTPTSQSIASGDYYGLGWTINGGTTWLHIGNSWGTAAMIVRQPNGFNWAIIENSDAPQKNNVIDLFYQLPPKLQAVTSWPSCDLF